MTIVIGVLVGYIILTNIIGIVMGRKVSSAPNYLFAGGKFGWILITAVLIGSWEGSGASIGITQQAFTKGIYPGFYSAFFSFGIVAAACFTLPIARKLGVVTLPHLLGTLFGPAGRSIAAVLFLLQELIVLSMQYVGAAGIFSALLHISFNQSVLLTLACVGIYMIMGGWVSAAWTNLFHAITLTLAAVIAVPFVLTYGGGFGDVVTKLPQSYFNVSGMGMSTLLGWYLVVASGPLIAQVSFSTAASASSESEARKGFFAAALIILLFATPFAIMGVVAKAYLPGTTSLLAMADLALSMNPWFAGLLFAGVLAAILSTLCPLIVFTPQIFINDIYRPLRKQAKDKEILLVSRISAAFFLVVGLLIALAFKNIVAATVFAFTFRFVLLCTVAIPLIFAFLKFITIEGGIMGLLLGAAAPIISLMLHSKMAGMYWAMLGVVAGIVIGSIFTRHRGHYVKQLWSYLKPNALEKTLKELTS